MKTDWPRIRPQSRRGTTTWCVDCGKVNGKRHCEFFSTNEQAEARAIELRAERKQLGEDAFALTVEQKRDAVRAAKLLAHTGVTLESAAAYWMTGHLNPTPHVTLNMVQKELLEAQERRGLRGASLAGTRSRYSSLLDQYGEQSIDCTTPPVIEGWLTQFTNDATRANVIRYLCVFFNFAMKRGYLVKSPMDQIEKPRLKYKVPEFLAVDQVEAILRTARVVDAGIVAKLALGFFAGIRPEELQRMDWQDISIENGLVTVRAEVAKCGIPRHVAISDNLKKWLAGCMAEQFKVNSFDERRKAVCAAAGVTYWPHDAMRHTFATMHLAAFENADKTAHELGHTQGVKLLFRHYRGLTTKTEAARYWGIEP